MAMPMPETVPIGKPQMPSNPGASNRRNRLRAFNEEKVEEKQIPDISDVSIPVSSPAPPPPQSPKNEVELLPKPEVKSDHPATTTTPPTTVLPEKPVGSTEKPKSGKEKDAGLGNRISTIWEGMKRMMGFAPECLNGGYRSIGSRTCTCPQYFEGQFCERPQCVNGGTRVRMAALGGEEVCQCPNPEYVQGKHCEQVHCQNGGRMLSDGTCHCVDGWYSGQFCQYYTSSWILAIGVPVLFIAIVIFCCVVCRMDLCALRRSQPPSRTRPGDRRSHGRRRQNCSSGEGRRTGGGGQNRHRREQIPFRQRDGDLGAAGRNHPPPHPHQHHLYIQQNMLNDHQQQYVLRLEQVPMYNPRLFVPVDKPLEPPPPYEQAILCPPPTTEPPNYCPQPAEPDPPEAGNPDQPTNGNPMANSSSRESSADSGGSSTADLASQGRARQTSNGPP